MSRSDIKYKSDLKNALINMDIFCGVTGPTVFDGNGDVVKKLYLLQIRGNKFVELD